MIVAKMPPFIKPAFLPVIPPLSNDCSSVVRLKAPFLYDFGIHPKSETAFYHNIDQMTMNQHHRCCITLDHTLGKKIGVFYFFRTIDTNLRQRAEQSSADSVPPSPGRRREAFSRRERCSPWKSSRPTSRRTPSKRSRRPPRRHPRQGSPAEGQKDKGTEEQRSWAGGRMGPAGARKNKKRRRGNGSACWWRDEARTRPRPP